MIQMFSNHQAQVTENSHHLNSALIKSQGINLQEMVAQCSCSIAYLPVWIKHHLLAILHSSGFQQQTHRISCQKFSHYSQLTTNQWSHIVLFRAHQLWSHTSPKDRHLSFPPPPPLPPCSQKHSQINTFSALPFTLFQELETPHQFVLGSTSGWILQKFSDPMGMEYFQI